MTFFYHISDETRLSLWKYRTITKKIIYSGKKNHEISGGTEKQPSTQLRNGRMPGTRWYHMEKSLCRERTRTKLFDKKMNRRSSIWMKNTRTGIKWLIRRWKGRMNWKLDCKKSAIKVHILSVHQNRLPVQALKRPERRRQMYIKRNGIVKKIVPFRNQF